METLFEAKAPPHLAFPNGTIKKHAHPPAPAANVDGEYRECLKNHAATLGGHAVDGCGEFTPSPTFDPVVPSSLTCAACGCHRNFHRRLVQNHHRHHREPNSAAAGDSEDEDDDGAGDLHAHHFRRPRHRSRSHSPPPPRHYSSASHMLLALSGGREAARSGPAHGGDQLHRRRARTKFSPEQKARMHELSEKLGWRMPKRDDGAVEEFCRRIGVERGVFKVWMHNNKQTFAGASVGTPTSRRAAEGGDGDGGGGGEADGAVGFPEGVHVNGGKFAVNGSPSSSSPS